MDYISWIFQELLPAVDSAVYFPSYFTPEEFKTSTTNFETEVNSPGKLLPLFFSRLLSDCYKFDVSGGQNFDAIRLFPRVLKGIVQSICVGDWSRAALKESASDVTFYQVKSLTVVIWILSTFCMTEVQEMLSNNDPALDIQDLRFLKSYMQVYVYVLVYTSNVL
jgi:hypothetical protein